MRQEIKTQGEQGVNAGDGDDPRPVQTGKHNRQEQQTDNQEGPRHDQVGQFSPGHQGIQAI